MYGYVAKTSAVAGALVGIEVLWAMLTSETVLPLVALASGVAGGIYWIYTAPKSKQLQIEIESHATQIHAWEKRLDESERVIDVTRSKLSVCKEALIEAAIRIKHLEKLINVDQFKNIDIPKDFDVTCCKEDVNAKSIPDS